MFLVYFLLWTLLLYILHRVVHRVSFIKSFHLDHHKYILNHKTKWNINNLVLINDNVKSTIDLWITEVIPTIIFCFITQQWWIGIFYYVWAAFFQENLEHNKKINWYPFTTGQWHMVHHKNAKKNFGLFLPIWDILFRTEQKV